MKFLTTNRFFRVIKRLLLLLPLSFIAVTSLYVVFNPNAKDSYYGETINEQILTDLDSKKQISSGSSIIMYGARVDEVTSIASSLSSIYCTTFTYNNVTYENVRFYFYAVNTSTNVYAYLRDSNEDLIFSDLLITNKTFEFVSYGNTFSDDAFNSLSSMMKLVTYNQYSYLNNSFEYGMYQFNQIGFGQLDLVSWFSGLFAINNNNVYIQFLNSYFNYFLLVECVAILPMFIHWGIHLFEDAVDYIKIGNKNRKGEE